MPAGENLSDSAAARTALAAQRDADLTGAINARPVAATSKQLALDMLADRAFADLILFHIRSKWGL